MRFGPFPIGEYKGKRPEADFFRFGHFLIGHTKENGRRRDFFEIGAFPYRKIQRKTAGGRVLRFSECKFFTKEVQKEHKGQWKQKTVQRAVEGGGP